MAGYDKLENLLRYYELNQLFEEGRDIDKEAYLKKLDSCVGDRDRLMEVYGELCALPMRADYRYEEPSELCEIEAESDCAGITDEYRDIDIDYFHGAWLGRCIGCAFGQPCEGWSSENIRAWYKNAGKYPITYYFPSASGTDRRDHPSTDEQICGMPLDDDTRFTVLNYLLLKQKGLDFDTWDVGSHWVWNLPIRFVCTAETQAYLNFVNVDGFTPWHKPENAMETLKKEGINTYLNPYREFIGAQIRADAFAYIAAGKPRLASRLAHTDAYLSHIKNGIYGEMFFAALISAAFTEKDVDKCIDTALAVVPKKSRFYEEMQEVRAIAESATDRSVLIDTLVARAGAYNWVHTINNAAFCLGAIIFAKGDFREAVTLAIECGCDTDCNGATVGSFMGALLGAQGIPEDLASAMKDNFSVGISPYDNYSILGFARELKELHSKLNS